MSIKDTLFFRKSQSTVRQYFFVQSYPLAKVPGFLFQSTLFRGFETPQPIVRLAVLMLMTAHSSAVSQGNTSHYFFNPTLLPSAGGKAIIGKPYLSRYCVE
jgi:hypothetical protein